HLDGCQTLLRSHFCRLHLQWGCQGCNGRSYLLNANWHSQSVAPALNPEQNLKTVCQSNLQLNRSWFSKELPPSSFLLISPTGLPAFPWLWHRPPKSF